MTGNLNLNVAPDARTMAGLRVLLDGRKHDFASIGGKQRFANLKDFDFIGLGSLSAAVDRLPSAEAAPLATADGMTPALSAKGTVGMDAFKLIRNAATKAPWHVPRAGYEVVQYGALMAPLLDTIQAADLHVAGSLEVLADGARVKVRGIVADPDYTIPVLQDTGDLLMMGFQAEASHDGSSGLNVSPFGVRVVCINDNLWGSFLPAVSIRHTASAHERVRKLGGWFGGMLETVPTIQARIGAAAEARLDLHGATIIALGAGIPARHVAAWKPNAARWEPSIRNLNAPLSAWQAYNSLGAYLSHGTGAEGQPVAGSSDNTEALLLKAEAFLGDDGARAEAMEAGLKVAEELRAKRAEQEAGKRARKSVRLTVPAIAGVTV